LVLSFDDWLPVFPGLLTRAILNSCFFSPSFWDGNNWRSVLLLALLYGTWSVCLYSLSILNRHIRCGRRMLELLLSFTMWLHDVYSFCFFRSFRSSDPLLCLNRFKRLRCLDCYRVLQLDLNKGCRLNLDIFRDFLLVLLLDIGLNQARRSDILKRYIHNFLLFLWWR